MRNAQVFERFGVKVATKTASISPDAFARLVGIAFSAIVAAAFWTFVISFACQTLGYPADASLLQGIAIAIIVFVSIAMAAIPAEDD